MKTIEIKNEINKECSIILGSNVSMNIDSYIIAGVKAGQITVKQAAVKITDNYNKECTKTISKKQSKTDCIKNCWTRMLNKKLNNGVTRIYVETGRYKGVYPQTVKAYSKSNGFQCWAMENGVWVIETNKYWLEDIKNEAKQRIITELQ